MESLEKRLAHYQEVHANPTDQLMHFVGIPAIFLAIVMFFTWFTLGIFGKVNIEFAWFGVIGLLVYYYFLNIRLAVAATVPLILVTWLATWLARPMPTKFSFVLFLILFIGGWVLLFVGHSFEKKKFSFTKNITQFAIAPLYIIVECCKKFGFESFLGTESKKPPSKKTK